MSVKIFTITHKKFTPPNNPMYIPLHVGRANAEDMGFLGDDTGDSISHLNPYFCELTGMYWLWKNEQNADYIGICHYRRYLVNEAGTIFTENQVKELLKKYDMITTKLLTLPGSYYAGFGANHHIKDLLATGDVIREKYPEYYNTFQTLIHGPHTYFGNIFITSKDMYNRYCSWLFDILFAVQKRTDFTGYNGYQKRLFGFLSEFLQTVWIQYHNLNVKECMVGMVGEKHETENLKEQLAAFFEKKDYAAAKKCFLECYKKRPDILMEASDINGELRLCMQIISTCEFEVDAYGHCILDTLTNYRALILHFRQLNSVVEKCVATFSLDEKSDVICESASKIPSKMSSESFPAATDSEAAFEMLSESGSASTAAEVAFRNAASDALLYFREKTFVTPVSIEIAVQLFCKDSSLASKIMEQLILPG